jgi:hypothetical protein
LGESGGALSAVWLVGKVRCYARSEPLSSSRFSRVGTDAGDLRNRGATGHAPGPAAAARGACDDQDTGSHLRQQALQGTPSSACGGTSRKGNSVSEERHLRTKPKSRGVKTLSGWCQSVRLWSSFLGGQFWKRIVTLGISGGRSLTGPLRDARRFPSTRWYPVPRVTRTTLRFGICPSFKGHSLSRRAQP